MYLFPEGDTFVLTVACMALALLHLPLQLQQLLVCHPQQVCQVHIIVVAVLVVAVSIVAALVAVIVVNVVVVAGALD